MLAKPPLEEEDSLGRELNAARNGQVFYIAAGEERHPVSVQVRPISVIPSKCQCEAHSRGSLGIARASAKQENRFRLSTPPNLVLFGKEIQQKSNALGAKMHEVAAPGEHGSCPARHGSERAQVDSEFHFHRESSPG